MITLYTAVGKCRFIKAKGNSYPVILLGNREFHLVPHEMLLWSSLAHTILTHQEAKSLFYEREKELHILSDQEFDHTLKRLILRGLVASGTDYTGVNALYRLLGPLYVASPVSFPFTRLAALTDLVLFKHLTLKSALRITKKEKLTPEEKHLLHRKDLEAFPVQTFLMEGEMIPSEHQFITTLVNLYFKNQIVFDTN